MDSHAAEAAIAKQMDAVRRELEGTGEVLSMAYLWARSGTLNVLAMPGLSDAEQRQAVRRYAAACDGVFVIVNLEVWVGSAAKTDQAAVAQLAADLAAQRVDQRPDRREAVLLWAEDEEQGIKGWRADITRAPGQPPVLGAWELLTFTLPRSGFRRYLPEKTPGTANATIIGSDKWSPHFKQLLEQGWLALREQLATRPAKADVGVIIEGQAARFTPRAELLKDPRFARLHSLRMENVPPDQVRVVVRALDGETGACRIPLASVQAGQVARG